MLTCNEFPSVSPGLAMAANIAVVVVPILDPRERGYALSSFITPIPETKKNTQENTELLICRIIVE